LDGGGHWYKKPVPLELLARNPAALSVKYFRKAIFVQVEVT
jgi:hypothetical protein